MKLCEKLIKIRDIYGTKTITDSTISQKNYTEIHEIIKILLKYVNSYEEYGSYVNEKLNIQAYSAKEDIIVALDEQWLPKYKNNTVLTSVIGDLLTVARALLEIIIKKNRVIDTNEQVRIELLLNILSADINSIYKIQV